MTYYSGQAFYKMPERNSGSFALSRPPPDPNGVWIHPHPVHPSFVFPPFGEDSSPYQICYPSPFDQKMQGYYDSYLSSHFHTPAYHQLPFSNRTLHQSHSPGSFEKRGKINNKYSRDQPKTFTSNNTDSKNRMVNRRGPLNEWRSKKVPSPRYDSDDSGIAESPNSVTWIVCDDMEEHKNLEEKLKLCSIDTGNIKRKIPEIYPNGGLEKTVNESFEKETFWSIADDEQFWRRLRQKPPSNYVINRIAAQVEYYLSDEYLLKDKYLLRQIRCKKDGYVSIKLITSFKKVKKLTKDWAVVRSALVRRSRKLVVSPEGLRIKRKIQLSDNLRKPRLLTSILVIRLPEDYNAVDRVTSLFSGFGEIEYVRLLRADKSIPADLRNYATQVPDIGHNLCAVVDFESAEDALNAVRTLKQFQKSNRGEESEDKEESENMAKYTEILADLPPLGEMRLALLGPRVRRTLYRQDRASESTEDDSSNLSMASDCLDDSDLVGEVATNMGDENDAPIILKSRKRLILSRKSISSNDVIVIRQPKGPGSGKGFASRKRSTSD